MSKRRKALREKAILYKGGKCELCGYNNCIEALDFHHNDKKSKKFGLSARGVTRFWKIVLLCSNCHREVHAGVTQLSA